MKNSDVGSKIVEGDCVVEDDVDQSAEGSLPERNEYFYDHILLHVKHYFQVCFNANIPIRVAQKHITIGSDFDGFINPFITIDSVEEMPSLMKYIKMNFGFYIKSLTDSEQWRDELNVSEFAEDLFYNNGFEFIKKFFKGNAVSNPSWCAFFVS